MSLNKSPFTCFAHGIYREPMTYEEVRKHIEGHGVNPSYLTDEELVDPLFHELLYDQIKSGQPLETALRDVRAMKKEE